MPRFIRTLPAGFLVTDRRTFAQQTDILVDMIDRELSSSETKEKASEKNKVGRQAIVSFFLLIDALQAELLWPFVSPGRAIPWSKPQETAVPDGYASIDMNSIGVAPVTHCPAFAQSRRRGHDVHREWYTQSILLLLLLLLIFKHYLIHRIFGTTVR